VIGSLEETMLKAKEFYAQGFRAFKIKVGKDFDLDIKRVCAVSQIVKKSQIILDANQGFTAPQTLRFLKELAHARVVPELIEQPVAKGDWEGLRQVTRSTKVCVCADESASSVADALRIIKDKSAGAINIKLMKTGIVHAVCIARWAKANNIKLMIGGMMESNLAMTASAHLAAGLGCFDFIDLDTPFFIKGAVAKNPYLSSKGIYDLSKAKAGIGIKSRIY
jgi:L-alanine-DL-glutamate epimerase-like enolase superfamily enzyme